MNFENAICSNNVKVLLNIEELKESSNLKNAIVFNRLFGFQNEGFINEPLRKNEQGYLTIFKDYNISSHNALDFLYFVRYGKLKYENNTEFMQEGDKKTAYIDLFIQNIDEVATSGIFLKFGPFPEFDTYVVNVLDKLYQRMTNETKNSKKERTNNPMTPEDDVNHLYYWTDCYRYPDTPFPENTVKFWEVTTAFKNASNKSYYRCLKLPVQV